MTLALITNDKLNFWFDFFNSILLVPRWVKLAEPYKVRLDINLGVPNKMMFMKPLLGPGGLPVLPSKDHTLDFADHL